MTAGAPGLLAGLEPIKQKFLETGDGLEMVRQRSDAVDRAVAALFHEAFGEQAASGVALVAVGGYGRRQLFPCSDVDLLFLFERDSAAEAARDRIAKLLRGLWDGGVRASHSVRTPAEAASLAPDNVELNISLLDARYLAGDMAALARLFERLPGFYAREKQTLARGLDRLTRARHAKHGDTIYHLEPNVKEAPGGLRDFQVACWLSQLAHAEEAAANAVPPEARGFALSPPEQHLPAETRDAWMEAKRFLFALRCYLHCFNGRDNNILTFENQERLAERAGASPQDAAVWMRDYFRNVRVIHRLARRTLDEVATPEHSLFTMFRDRKSRLSNPDFAVARGMLYMRHPEALVQNPGLAMRLFEFIARHGVPPAPETERRIGGAAGNFREYLRKQCGASSGLWFSIASILRLPHAYQALVVMRETGLLAALFPEYERIDCLVVRDFYHRYTVDEHSLRTIKTLHELRAGSDDALTQHFSELMQETERPEVLLFALLFHDVGKGGWEGNHTTAGLALAEQAMERIGMPEPERETVRFLIAHHLDMPAIMTGRDLADPETARAFASQVGTLERLQSLTLMTYADISAVNPEALTPWRKDLLWQLYVATHNQLTREMEAERIGTGAAVAAQLASNYSERQALARFLEGLPTRYLRIHGPDQIRRHFQLKPVLERRSVAVQLGRRHSLYELVVLARDRAFLLASIAGTISSFAMNIVKAEAFSNRDGMILDTFIFADPNRTLELNPSEADRLTSTLEQVVLGKIDVRELLHKRRTPAATHRPRIARHIAFDNQTSPNETLFHVITEDRPGLLYDLASTFSFNRCDIDVVLIDTEGRKAIDVFYVRSKGRKLDDAAARRLCQKLERACSGSEE
jgi:[protein-PII] uridylyltransferase